MMVTIRYVGHYLLLDGHFFIQARLSNNVSTGKKHVYILCRKKRQNVGTREQKKMYRFGFGLMVSNATFNNISVISWRSVLLKSEGYQILFSIFHLYVQGRSFSLSVECLISSRLGYILRVNDDYN